MQYKNTMESNMKEEQLKIDADKKTALSLINVNL